MKEVFREHMTNDDSSYLQCLHFEKESYKEVLGYILLEKRQGYEYSKDNYSYFMSEFREANMKYNLTFQALVAFYAPEYSGNDNYEVLFNFETQEIIIYEKEGDILNED